MNQTLSFLKDVIVNRPIEWVDLETGDVDHAEHMSRWERFHHFRPTWTFTVLTTNPGCGCRKRFGLWHTMWCSKHLPADLQGEVGA